ncbi:membrane protein [Mycobacterium phage Cuke]|uniref:Uncharacterized protein n=1 Tax=Mycobacterium phage Cuke TaxID=2079417 RepID=A0A2L1IWV4_9CAUD|nr:membrane protein [Mycobacterium phage Cuke]AVD99690.1 hypothetical protein SEA_CUKE_74 [Mycobacterium phage Cuke]
MIEIGSLAIGFSVGLITSSILLIGVQRRLTARVLRHAKMEATADDLEKRRLATDFGIDELPRLGTGPIADESNLFEVRPGRMHLAHLATKRGKKLPESVDQQQNPTTLD